MRGQGSPRLISDQAGHAHFTAGTIELFRKPAPEDRQIYREFGCPWNSDGKSRSLASEGSD